jgi:hypothetical protein
VELDARLQSDGTFLAQEVERETTTTNQQLRGLVLERTPVIGGGSLTSLELLVLDAIPTPLAAQAPGEIVTVTVDGTTAFRVSSEDLPLASFPNQDFDRDALRIGQFIHVVQRSGAGGFTADAITLEEIALTGQVGTIGVSTFNLSPDPVGDPTGFFAVNGLDPIIVVTTTVTEFENMPAGLGSLTANQSIVGVRGVLVFSAGSGVLVVKRVRLLVP